MPRLVSSFFSGVEASHNAIQMAGVDWETVSVSEIEPFANEVLKYRLPNVPNKGDFTKVTPSDFYDSEIFVGGPPCQSFSIAGKRGGLDDDRGNLTLQYMELCHDCADNGSLRLAFYENVPGILSDKTNAFGSLISGFVGGVDALCPPNAVWGSNEDGTLGWQQLSWPSFGMASGPRARLAWRTLDAQWFGLAQRRRRVFIVVCFDKRLDPAKILFERKGLQGNTPPSRKQGEGFAADAGDGVAKRDKDGLTADVAPCLKANGSPRGDQKGIEDSLIPEIAHTLRGEGFDAREDGTGRGTPLTVECAPIASTLNAAFGDKLGLEGQHINSGAPLFVTEQRPIAFSAKDDLRDVQEDLCPTLRVGGEGQSGGADHKAVAFDMRGREGGAQMEGPHDTANIRAASGGSSKSYIAEPFTYGLDTSATPKASLDISGTIVGTSASGGGQPAAVAFKIRGGCEGGGKGYLGSEDRAFTVSTLQDQHIHQTNYAVRRLMPVETEALQGFPPGWTKIPRWRVQVPDEKGKIKIHKIYGDIPAEWGNYTAEAIPCPDGGRYKGMGNSWAVNCVAWIFARIDLEFQRVDAL